MSRLFPPLLCSILLAVVSAPAAPLRGLIDGDTYVSPTGQFRVRTPVRTELGGKITDTTNVVTFQDDFGTHVSIACFELDATQRWEYDTRGLRDYLLYFLTDLLMANFSARFPGATIESARFLPQLMEGALIGYVLLPGGSEFEHFNRVTDAPPADPVVAKRGTLLFVRHRYLYAISTELSERATQRSTYTLTREQEDEQLSARLIALSGRLTFTNDRPRTP
ncbi:hypothetical protein Verru16b_03004 [Lacunisphaera limnophila]|uniref:Uncharacterized protein n=1 Tax=Lacunisphaera limnophila TaxID=1838286 RepID=A0A1D8AYD9_9BACT|nr:hypothetical protein [Lacunisphaera limnophila]AOS45913.1 hypothetical protein Verru16b_03004 [Lacunisphaera limnophila]